MNTTEHILVIFLSAALALLLTLSVTVVIMLIVLVRRLQTIASKAESVADAAMEIGKSLSKSVESFTFFRMVRVFMDTFSKRKNHKEG